MVPSADNKVSRSAFEEVFHAPNYVNECYMSLVESIHGQIMSLSEEFRNEILEDINGIYQNCFSVQLFDMKIDWFMQKWRGRE